VTWQVTFEPAAQAEIAEEQLTRNPQAFPPARGRFRRILLRRFPYALHFELLSEQRVSVLACLHHRRSPARWPGN